MSLETDLSSLLNRYSRENDSNTPDFILASYLLKCLNAYEAATVQRDRWYGIAPCPGGSSTKYLSSDAGGAK